MVLEILVSCCLDFSGGTAPTVVVVNRDREDGVYLLHQLFSLLLGFQLKDFFSYPFSSRCRHAR